MQNQVKAEIKKLLRLMQTEEVSAAENQLTEYAKHPGFFELMVEMMRETSDQQWLRTVGASFLNNILLNCAQEQSNQVSMVLKKVIFDPCIRQIDKRCFERALVRTINSGSQQVRNEWLLIMGELLKSKQNFDSAYLVLACFAIADEIPYITMRNIVQSYFEPILCSLEVCVENANLLNQMVKMWIVIFDSLRKDPENQQTLFFMANSQKLLDLIDLLYEFESGQDNIVCFNEAFVELNLLKYEAAQLNKRLLIYADDAQTYCRTLDEYTRKNFPKFAKTLHLLAQKIQLFEDLGCEDLLTTLISIQQLYILKHPEEFSFEVAVSIIQCQIFPFIPIRDDEREKFQESPDQFNSLAEDCCDKQTFGILKTQALKLLESIGDKIQGVLKYVLIRAIQSIKIGLGFVTAQINQTVLPVESSFLILSVFSYGIGHYEAELAAIKVILCDERIRTMPPVEISRVFTFLAYNYNEIYKVPSEGEHWIGFALSYRVHPTTRFCAFDFLTNIVDDYFNEVFLEALINQIATSQIALIWDITTKIVESHFCKLSTQGLVLIVSKLFERIRLEIQLIESKQKENSLDLNNCIQQFSHILIALRDNLPEVGENSEKYQNVLAAVWPITELYQTASKWDLEDEIVKVAINIMNVVSSIPIAMQALVPQFITLYKHNGYFEKVYLQFFNQFVLKADFQRDQQPLIEILIVLKDSLLSSLTKVALSQNGKFTGSQQQRVTLGNNLIVIQNILATHGTNLVNSNSVGFFDEIGSICIRLLPSPGQHAESSSTGRIIMSRALNTLFLCHMHLKTQCFYNYLDRLKGENLYHGYDTYVFTLCVSKEVFRETDISVITFLIEALLQIVGKSSEKEENISKKKKGKAKIKHSTQIKKITDMDKILKKITTPFGQNGTIGDEIMNLFTKMHAGNAAMVNQIFQTITPESFEIAKKYVDVENLGKKKRVYRKIVGIKQGPSNTQTMQGEQQPRLGYANSQGLEEDSDQEIGLKRQRTKVKTEGKKKRTARKIDPRNCEQ